MADKRDNPYVGPRAFTRQEKDLFFGRDLEARDLLSMVLSERVVLFYAQSGAGKSSLIRARLVPALEESYDFFVLPIGRVNAEPGALAEVQDGWNVFVYNLLHSINDQTEGEVPEIGPELTLAQYLRLYSGEDEDTAQESQAGLQAQPQALVIDQFEELITAHQEAWTQREGFFVQLSEALRQDAQLWVILALREDYLAALDPYAYLVPGRLRARFYMQRLGERAALEAIGNPAAEYDRPFEPAVAEELVRRLRTPHSAGKVTARPGQFVEPLQLQVVCHQLWESIRDEPGETITLQDLDRAGDIDRALSGFYDQVLAEVAAQTSVSEMTLRNWIEMHLITDAGTRGFVYEGETETHGLPNEAVALMDALYLLNAGTRADRNWYELAHDRLVQPIIVADREWWTRQSPLVRAAKAWEDSGRDDSALQLDQALRETLGDEGETKQDPLVVEFIRAARQRERQLRSDLSETGWGVIFAADTDPAIREALEELLTHRKKQAKEKYRDFTGRDGYHSGDSAHGFLKRHGVSSGSANRERVPYYLLIVGDPASIPYAFQYQLAASYAVGRIHFDALEDYARYARSVVQAETAGLALPRRVSIFGVVNPGDTDTEKSDRQLVRPLARDLKTSGLEWEFTTLLEDQSTKGQLHQLLGGEQTPALLFTVSRGMPFPLDDPRQRDRQGALLCRDYPGPNLWSEEEIPQTFYFGADDVSENAALLGTVAVFCAHYSAGTPKMDEFPGMTRQQSEEKQAKKIAPAPFVAQLPKRLLSHPRGGALAVVGHVERIFDYSPENFLTLVKRLLNGHPVGSALEPFGQRYAERASSWAAWEILDRNAGPDEILDKAEVETEMVDARNYVIIGDPAVRLWTVEDKDRPEKHPAISPTIGTRPVKIHPDSVCNAVWNRDGSKILTTCADGVARVWETETSKVIALDAKAHGWTNQASWSPDGRFAVTIDREGNAHLFDTSSGQGMHRLASHLAQDSVRAWSPDGQWIAFPNQASSGFHIREVASGLIVQQFESHTEQVQSVVWSPRDNRFILTTSADAPPRLWDAEAGQELFPLGDRWDQGGLAAWSLDGAYVAVTSTVLRRGSYIARIWEATEGKVVGLLRGHTGPIRALCWVPNGGGIMTMAEDGTTRMWDEDTGELRYLRDTDVFDLESVSFSPTGKLAMTIGSDKAVHLWDTASGIEIRNPQRDMERVSSVAFSPDGTHILAITGKQTVRVWGAPDETGYSLHIFNGINGVTGGYAVDPVTNQYFVGTILGRQPPKEPTELRYAHQLRIQAHL